MQSRFSIRGHPLHPLLVAIPIGLFIWTFIADLVYLGSDKDGTWYDISLWTGVAAIFAALVAAVPGFGDYLTVALHSDSRIMATLHMVLNLAVVALFAIAAALAIDDGATSGGALAAMVLLHAVGVGLLSISGALGGEMVYRHHLAMIPDDIEQDTAERRRHLAEAQPHVAREPGSPGSVER
jgi:uncharacterized membrane protein